MERKRLLEQSVAIQMARNYCYLLGLDPDEVTIGTFLDANGVPQRVGKARWRWYQGIIQPDACASERTAPTMTEVSDV
ncbi:hypothetical protein GCM10007884_35700 [Methylobacterium brachythecii]|uniref:Uncharacterized protein n=1 Tax=Methylobacterium brachythecii TaxID=1176177 RepID=A0ABQ6D5K2_9HYPH|nr:hypothetical protein GCM10007884_35700 [Methylobacterium brachythecii]